MQSLARKKKINRFTFLAFNDKYGANPFKNLAKIPNSADPRLHLELVYVVASEERFKGTETKLIEKIPRTFSRGTAQGDSYVCDSKGLAILLTLTESQAGGMARTTGVGGWSKSPVLLRYPNTIKFE